MYAHRRKSTALSQTHAAGSMSGAAARLEINIQISEAICRVSQAVRLAVSRPKPNVSSMLVTATDRVVVY